MKLKRAAGLALALMLCISAGCRSSAEAATAKGPAVEIEQAESSAAAEGAGAVADGAGSGAAEGAGAVADGAGSGAAAGGSPAAESTQAETKAAVQTKTMYVNANSLNIRTSGEIREGNVVKSLGFGEAVEVAGITGKWASIPGEDKMYFAAAEFLSETMPTERPTEAAVSAEASAAGAEAVGLSSSWKYAENSAIHSGHALLYRAEGNRKNRVICVNAGHGTKGGEGSKTLSHPDGSPKVTGGTTGAGAVKSIAISSGMTFSDGTSEASVTLRLAQKLKPKLLAAGYDVLMIRENNDAGLDNIARTVIANNMADCHIALHWDSTGSNKGAFYMSVPNIGSYRAMEPVASHWQEHNRLGDTLIGGLRSQGVKIWNSGALEMDLTQTSYSTIPSVDIELGDKASDHSDGTLDVLAEGLLAGVNAFFGN